MWEKLTLKADWEKTTREQFVAYGILCSIARSLKPRELQKLWDEIATKRRASVVADRFKELDTDNDAKLSYGEVKIETNDPAS